MPQPMSATLVVIDIQNDYFPGGAYPLVGPEDAAAHARELLDGFRETGRPIVHLKHVWDAPDATFMRPGTPGVKIHALVSPIDDEPVIVKAAPNGFLGTDLRERLGDAESIVVCGMMSSMCVDATVRAAADLGFSVTVAHDACAAPDLEFNGQDVAGATVHAAFMAALADGYARVISTREVLGDL